MTEPAPFLRFQHVSKRFPGARALADVSFDVARGSCHALCGENGAGKSTLGKILAGIDTPDSGQILVDGTPVAFEDPRDALAVGIAMVHQELAFCENLSVAENLCLADLPRRGLFVSRSAMVERAKVMMAAAAIEAPIDVRRLVGDLTVAEQQMLQIAAAVAGGARVIIFDEPTSSLSEREAEHFYALLGRLREKQVTAVYVSHRMPEIFRLCDTVTVLRDGRHVATRAAAALPEAELVELMIGRRLDEYLPTEAAAAVGPELLRVSGLASPGKFTDVSFSVRAGEVVGIAGLVGAGRSDIAKAIFGLDPEVRGRIAVAGMALPLGSPSAAMRAGMGFVPEDRKRQGLVMSLPALHNLTLPTLGFRNPRRVPDLPRRASASKPRFRSRESDLASLGWILPGRERALAADAFSRLKTSPPDLDYVTAGLSGGNQQKIVLAKWLAARCRLLILDEPTRGVDVGAKAEIHALVGALAAEGTGVLLISSELPELIALSTRVLVLREGRLVGELERAEVQQPALLRLMAGLST